MLGARRSSAVPETTIGNNSVGARCMTMSTTTRLPSVS
jgi:hypothetical protein